MIDVFKNHKVGDKVWNFKTRKWETIKEIITHSKRPFIETDESSYFLTGQQFSKDASATIYPNKFEIPAEAYNIPRYNRKKGNKNGK